MKDADVGHNFEIRGTLKSGRDSRILSFFAHFMDVIESSEISANSCFLKFPNQELENWISWLFSLFFIEYFSFIFFKIKKVHQGECHLTTHINFSKPKKKQENSQQHVLIWHVNLMIFFFISKRKCFESIEKTNRKFFIWKCLCISFCQVECNTDKMENWI